jgi:hypothetical protein
VRQAIAPHLKLFDLALQLKRRIIGIPIKRFRRRAPVFGLSGVDLRRHVLKLAARLVQFGPERFFLFENVHIHLPPVQAAVRCISRHFSTSARFA